MAIRSTGLKNLTADYHASNYYPQVEKLAQMRYDASIQLWTKHLGKGFVTVISIISNFADAFMDTNGDIVPDSELRKVFDLEFETLKRIISNQRHEDN